MPEKRVMGTNGVSNFVGSMLKSAQEVKEVKPQTRFDAVDPKEIEKVLENLKRGVIRSR